MDQLRREKRGFDMEKEKGYSDTRRVNICLNSQGRIV